MPIIKKYITIDDLDVHFEVTLNVDNDLLMLFLYADDEPINYVNLTKHDVKILIEDLSNLYSIMQNESNG